MTMSMQVNRGKEAIWPALFLTALVLSGCHKQSSESSHRLLPLLPVEEARLSAADSDVSNWLTYGRNYAEQRFSPLDQIDEDSVRNLGLAWSHDLADGERGQQATPLVVDGSMYVSTSWSRVIALNAATGKVKWEFDPKVPREWGINLCCDAVNRGVAVWRDKIFIGTLDGRLIAVDAETGEVRWESLVVDRSHRYSITGAPRVVKGKVLIGSAGGDYGVRGFLAAYNVESGDLLWRFYTAPGDPSMPDTHSEPHAKATSWNGQWWKYGGGATVWDAMAYDPELDLLYFGTGNGSPWAQSFRSPGGGDNLYVSSIVAIRPDTREYVWHYQTTPGDEWGYDAASQLILAELNIGGAPRRVIMQASANGFFYVIDRTNGGVLSATPYVPTTWARGIDPATGRPIENPEARYSRTGKSFDASPGRFGAHSWQPMSLDPQQGLVFIPAMENTTRLAPLATLAPSRFAATTGVEFVHAPHAAPDSSKLVAWDPVKGEERWHVSFASPQSSGVLATAGNLLFQGTTTGELIAYRSSDGRRLWTTPTHTSVTAAPISYMVEGRQYLAVVVGAGGAVALAGGKDARASGSPTNIPRILVYALDGTLRLPPATTLPAPRNVSLGFTPHGVAQGATLFARYCASCHGQSAINAGPLPDLLKSAVLTEAMEWKQIVYAGKLHAQGMPGYFAELDPTQVEGIRQYVLSISAETRP